MESTFARLLSRHRAVAGLTQEALAERAGLSAAAISSLERGARRFPQGATVGALADALGLVDEQRETFVAVTSRRRLTRRSVRGPEVPWSPHEIPAAISDFTGREQHVRTMTDALTGVATMPAVVVSAIAGMGGVGKTTLAVHVGHRLSEQFADGQLYINLRGFGPGEPMRTGEALGRLLESLGVPTDQIPTDIDGAAARYRSLLAGRRALIILDNVADAGQAAHLLPGTAGCAAIVTSRRTLVSLAGAHHIQLDVLTETEALRLLGKVAGHNRVEAEPDAAREIVRHCGCLPLAIRIAGARVTARPQRRLDHLAVRLADERRRFDELTSDSIGVRASLAESIKQLAGSPDPVDKGATRAFTLLGLSDGPDVTTHVAARLLDLPVSETESILDRLVDLNLLTEQAPGLHRLHDLLRAYAREYASAVISEHDRAAALDRVLELYAAAAWRALALVQPAGSRLLLADDSWTDQAPPFGDALEAMEWLDEQRPHLLAALHQAATGPDVSGRLGVRLALGLFGFYTTRHFWHDWAEATRVGLASAETDGDWTATSMLRHDLGLALARLAEGGAGGYEESLDHLRRSLLEFRRRDDGVRQAACLANIALVLELADRLDDAIETGRRGLALSQQLEDVNTQAILCRNLGSAYGKVGDVENQLSYLQRSCELLERAGNWQGLGRARRLLGIIHREAGRHPQALADLRSSVHVYQQQAGDPVGEAESLDELGALYLALGDHQRALECQQRGVVIAASHGDGHREASLRRRMGLAFQLAGRGDSARNEWRRALAICERDDLGMSDEIRSLLAQASPDTPK